MSEREAVLIAVSGLAGIVIAFVAFPFALWKAWHDGDYSAGTFYLVLALGFVLDYRHSLKRLKDAFPEDFSE